MPAGKRSQPRANDLDGEAWVDFLATLRLERLDDSACRALHRWRNPDPKTGYPCAPSVWSADRFLVSVCGLTIDAFFIWCELKGRSPWALGHPPAWHEAEIDAETVPMDGV